jgi:hypothetical protein
MASLEKMRADVGEIIHPKSKDWEKRSDATNADHVVRCLMAHHDIGAQPLMRTCQNLTGISIS